MLDRSNDTDRPSRRTALIAQELSRYGVDITALSETRLADEGSITEDLGGYTFFWKGLPQQDRRIHGVAFAIRSSLLGVCEGVPVGISERLMRVRLPLAGDRYATIFSCYAPTLAAETEAKERFYEQLDAEISRVPFADKLILLGDFNARVGTEHLAWAGVIGRHGTGKMNDNGHRLLSLCAQNELFITNTGFMLKPIHKGTWTHPRSKHVHMLDYVITRKRDRQDVLITRVMRGAECWTDHYLVRSKFSLRIRPPTRRKPAKRKLNCVSLCESEKRNNLSTAISEKLAQPITTGVERGWDFLSKNVMEIAVEELGYSTKRNKDWFDANADGIHELLETKYKANAAYLNNPSSAFLKRKWRESRSEVQRVLREMENQWWLQLAAEVQGYADSGDLQNFYAALKKVYGPSDRSLAPVKSQDGSTLYTDKRGILERWKEHYSSLLNTRNPINLSCLESIPQLSVVREMDLMPTIQEVISSVNSLKNNKAPGVDDIPAEVLKYGGETLHARLHDIITAVWDAEDVPQQWKDAKLTSIFKKKGDRATCGNSRGISLLAVAGKVLAKILLARLNKHIVDRVCPESQCGFRRERGTIDMLFVLRQLQEKCREQRRDLCMAFIDLSKAFDTVNREMLWSIMERFGCPGKFVAVVRSFHNGMRASVVIGSEETESFGVEVGVKQGCVMAPVIFNLYLAAATFLYRARASPDCSINISYRLDGSLFNLRRLKAPTKVSGDSVAELQYADDCALVAHTPDHLQEGLTILAQVYEDLGLLINVNKTEILYQWSGGPPAVVPDVVVGGQDLKVTDQFTYLGGLISSDCTVDAEINSRINKASAAFARIRQTVLYSHNLKLVTKVSVYKAICLSVLLYGSETLTLHSRHVKLLEGFHMRCVKRILGLTWRDRIPHTDMLARTGLQSIECMLLSGQLRWVGHVCQMPEGRYSRRLLYGQLNEGNRPAHGPKKRYKDHVKSAMKGFGMDPLSLERDASDRNKWRAACHKGANHFEELRTQRRHEQRQQRHAARDAARSHNANSQALECPDCGRLCGSAIGLWSHRRVHRRDADRESQVIIDIDGHP